MRPLLAAVLLSVAVGASLSAADRQLYVHTMHAEVLDSTGWPCKRIAGLQRGDLVTVIGKKEDWYQVRLPDEREGWVAENRLKADKPRESGMMAAIGRSVRGGNSDNTAATAGGRGLGPIAEKYANHKGGDAVQAAEDIKWLEKHQPDPAAMRRFMGEGRVGDFK